MKLDVILRCHQCKGYKHITLGNWFMPRLTGRLHVFVIHNGVLGRLICIDPMNRGLSLHRHWAKCRSEGSQSLRELGGLRGTRVLSV